MSSLKVLKALADETRLQILSHLLKSEHSVLEIVALVKMSQPTVSIALRKLEEAGVVGVKRDGKKMVYSVQHKERLQKILELVRHG